MNNLKFYRIIVINHSFLKKSGTRDYRSNSGAKLNNFIL